MSGETGDAERFLALVASLEAQDPRLSPIQAGLLAAARLGIAGDSRTFAHGLGLAHALVLRELAALDARGDLVRLVKRDGRTMRTHFALHDDTSG